MTAELRVVVDTNAFWGDWYLEAKAWSEMHGYVERGRLHICVPKVVVQELVRAYRREANNLLGRIQELKPRALKQLLDLDLPPVAEFKRAVDARNDAYEATLRARLVALGAEIVPLPTVPHQELLTRALHNRQPFDGEGKNGYRDALIWHTVLDVCQGCTGKSHVLFITNNTSDFCDTTSGTLTAQLLKELENYPTVSFVHVKSLSDAAKQLQELIVEPDEAPDVEGSKHGDDGVWDASEPDRVHALVVEALSQACEKLAQHEVANSNDVDEPWRSGLDFTGFRTVIEAPVTVEEVTPDLSSLDWSYDGDDTEGRRRLEASVRATVTLEGMAFKADYYGENSLDISVYDGDWNDHYMWIGTHHSGRLYFSLTLNEDGSAVEETDFDHAEEDDPEEPSPRATS